MKVYLASRYSKQEEMRQYAAELEALGFEVTSRWIRGNHSADGLEGVEKFRAGQRFATEDFEDVMSADAMILFSDPPRTATRGGKNFEFGAAYAANKRIFVVGEKENVFHYLPHLTICDNWENAKASIYTHAFMEKGKGE